MNARNCDECLRYAVEVRELKQRIAELESLAFKDELTGVLNRRGFVEEANLILSLRKHHDVAVVFVDLDDFKPVNDTYGHEAGDMLLKKVAFLMQAQIRTGDIVARMGGDEFAILLTDTDLESAIRVAKKIKKTLREYRFGVNGNYVKIGASIGVSSSTQGTRNLKKLLRIADKEMYRRKKKKKR